MRGLRDILAFGFAGALALVLGATQVQAASVYGTAAPFSGSRSVDGGGLVVVDFPATSGDWSDAIISWDISDLGGGSFLYEYTFENFVGPPAISHIAIDLTDDAESDSNVVTDPELNGVSIDLSDVTIGDVEGITVGVKFDVGDPDGDGSGVVYSFISNRLPVFGHIAVEAGQEQTLMHALLTNSGFGDQTLSDPNAYIARPNGLVPTPAAFGIGIAGMGLMLMRRRR